MQRVAKLEGKGNIVLEEVAMPSPAPTEVLIQTKASLISRGSELWRRYILEEAVDPAIMGYSVAGIVAEVGADVHEFRVGDRVAALAPHAEYVVMEVKDPRHQPSVVALPDPITFEEGTFWPLSTSSVCWSWSASIRPGDTVVILGQGLVGSLMLQVVRPWGPARLIAVDRLPARCALAERLGADHMVNGSLEDPLKAIRTLTEGRGADVVIEAVGGTAGVQAFQQGLELTRSGGRMMLIGLYQGTPLPVDASQIMSRQILGANQYMHQRASGSRVALQMLATHFIQAAEMITHRFDAALAKEAFDLLYECPGDALGVILHWDAC